MADETVSPLDLNASSAEELAQLPGVGPTLAERIIAGRPYGDVADLQRLEGIGERKLEQLTPHLSIKAEDTKGEGAEAPEPLPAEMADQTPRAPTPTLWWIAAGVIVAVLASVVLNLAILATINGSLRFSRRTSERAMTRELDLVGSDLSDLEERLRAAEQESRRLSDIASRLDGAAQRLEAVGSDIDQMQEDLLSIQDRLEMVEGQTGRADRFLGELQNLLQELLGPPDLDQDAAGAAP